MDGGSPEPPSSINEQSMPKLNLATCKDIKFEEQENTLGVSYVTASGEAGSTPVQHRRSRSKSETSKSDSSGQEEAEHNFQALIKSA